MTSLRPFRGGGHWTSGSFTRDLRAGTQHLVLAATGASPEVGGRCALRGFRRRA